MDSAGIGLCCAARVPLRGDVARVASSDPFSSSHGRSTRFDRSTSSSSQMTTHGWPRPVRWPGPRATALGRGGGWVRGSDSNHLKDWEIQCRRPVRWRLSPRGRRSSPEGFGNLATACWVGLEPPLIKASDQRLPVPVTVETSVSSPGRAHQLERTSDGAAAMPGQRRHWQG